MAGIKRDPETVVVQLTGIERHGSIAVGSGVTQTSQAVSVAVDLRFAYDLAREIARGRKPIVVVEPWAVLPALPRRTS